MPPVVVTLHTVRILTVLMVAPSGRTLVVNPKLLRIRTEVVFFAAIVQEASTPSVAKKLPVEFHVPLEAVVEVANKYPVSAI